MSSEKLVVIPDIHGCLDPARRLVDRLEAGGYLKDRKLVFLGDYFDKGPAVKQLVDFLIELQDQGHVVLAGNHEYTLMRALQDGPDRARRVGRWALAYENQTLSSYGVVRKEGQSRMDRADELRQRMPPEHIRFLGSLPWVYESGNLVAVHAGLDPDQDADEQIRRLTDQVDDNERGPTQLHSRKFNLPTAQILGKLIVSGHTIRDKPYISSGRVLLDCGVCAGGPLVAWVADTGQVLAEQPTS